MWTVLCVDLKEGKEHTEGTVTILNTGTNREKSKKVPQGVL